MFVLEQDSLRVFLKVECATIPSSCKNAAAPVSKHWQKSARSRATGERISMSLISMSLMSMALSDLGMPAISFTGSQPETANPTLSVTGQTLATTHALTKGLYSVMLLTQFLS
jgi:hypothetical protein